MTIASESIAGLPDMKVSVRQVFGIDSDLEVPAFSEAEEHVPDVDPDYLFDRTTTLANWSGFAARRIPTPKSTIRSGRRSWCRRPATCRSRPTSPRPPPNGQGDRLGRSSTSN